MTVLESSLTAIVNEKHYNQDNWPELLPLITGKLQTLSKFESTKEKCNKLIIHLQTNFNKNPPFTILRLSEILLKPQKEGYLLDNEINEIKYFNALSKIINVSSSIDKFPKPLQREAIVGNGVNKSGEDIPLVKIPWLEEAKEQIKKDNEKKEKEEKQEQEKQEEIREKRLSIGDQESPLKRRKEGELQLESVEIGKKEDAMETSLDSSIDSSPLRSDTSMEMN